MATAALDETEKGFPARDLWKEGGTPHVLFTRARVTGTTYARQATPNPKNVQRHASVGVRVRYQKGDETTIELQFLGSLDGVSYQPLPQNDAASSGNVRARPFTLTLNPADFPDTINKGALTPIAPFDDGLCPILISVAGCNFLDVQKKRTGGTDGGAGFVTVEVIGGGTT